LHRVAAGHIVNQAVALDLLGLNAACEVLGHGALFGFELADLSTGPAKLATEFQQFVLRKDVLGEDVFDNGFWCFSFAHFDVLVLMV
jgi:hypothetical protein